ncbi:MAG: S-layer homology domain-containing protein [Tepidibacillus sp.]
MREQSYKRLNNSQPNRIRGGETNGMKKLVNALLIFALVLTMVTPAFAATPSDVKGTVYEDAVAKLNALGVITGHADGTYKPLDKITRKEFAAIIVRATGHESDAKLLSSTNPFPDVKAGEWYTGYVAAAKAYGFINGKADGNFDPAANIKGSEVLAVLLRALGYNDSLPGEWPYDYLIKANSLGILTGVDFTAGVEANRGVVAQLTAGTLEKEVVTYDKEKDLFTSTSQTFIDSKLGLTFQNAVVTAPSLNADGKIELNGTYTAFADDAYVGSWALGENVRYLVNKDGKVTYLTASTNDVVTGTLKVDATATTLNLGDPDKDGNDNLYTFADTATVFFNGVKQADVNGKVITKLTADANVKLFLDSAKNVRFVVADKFDRSAEIVKSVTVTSRYNRIDSGASAYFVDAKAKVTLNGVPATVSDIKEGYVVYVSFPGGDTTKAAVVVEAYNNTASGVVTRTTSTSVTVNGVEYKYATGFDSSVIQLGKEFKLTLDKDSKVIKAEEVTSTTTANKVKAFFLSVDPYQTVIDGKVTDVADVKVLGLDGKIVTYRAVESTVNLTAGNLYEFTLKADGKLYTDNDTTTNSVDETPVAITVTTAGEIKTDGINGNVITLTDSKSFLVDSNTVILQVPTAGVTADTKETDVKVLTLADLKAGYQFNYALNTVQTTFTYVFVTNAPAPTTKAADVYGFFVEGTAAQVWDAANNTTKNVYTATVNVNGSNVTYTVDADLSGTTQGTFGKLVDENSNGVYEGFTAIVPIDTAVNSTKLKVDATNKTFALDGAIEANVTTPVDYIVTANTKILLVEKDSQGNNVYVVGQFSDLLTTQDGTVVGDTYTVTVVTDGTLGGYNVASYVVIEKN